MSTFDPAAPAELIESIHCPAGSTVAECLGRWSALDPGRRSTSYLVVHGHAGLRHTFSGRRIHELAAHLA